MTKRIDIEEKDIDILKLRTATGTVQEFIVILNHDHESHLVIQQTLRDYEYGKDIHSGKMMLLLPSTFKEMAQNSMKWLNLQTDLEKLGMTKEMKLLIEKSFANEFKDHNQNQKLRELIENEIASGQDGRLQSSLIYLQGFLDRSKK